jgi:hypothetical protein
MRREPPRAMGERRDNRCGEDGGNPNRKPESPSPAAVAAGRAR